VYCGVLRVLHHKTPKLLKKAVLYIKIFLRVFAGKQVVIAVFAGRKGPLFTVTFFIFYI
jgi:hypothetical protein